MMWVITESNHTPYKSLFFQFPPLILTSLFFSLTYIIPILLQETLPDLSILYLILPFNSLNTFSNSKLAKTVGQVQFLSEIF